MKNKNFKIFLLASAIPFCILCISNSTFAYTIPNMCQGGTDSVTLRAYDLGLAKGRALIENEWNKIQNSCTALVSQPDFRANVFALLDDLSIPPDSGDHVICHYYAYMNGISDKLKEIDSVCKPQCVLTGEFVGEIAARLYCELSIGFDGITDWDFVTSILSVCDSEMEDTCDSTYNDTTAAYVNVFGLQCNPFAHPSDSYDDWAWTWIRNRQCQSIL